MPLPLSSMPRTMRMAWVVGKISPIHCAHSGMPANGVNMNPDSRNDGSRVNCAICWRLHLVGRHRREGEAERQIAGDEQAERSQQQGSEPRIGKWKTSAEGAQDKQPPGHSR